MFFDCLCSGCRGVAYDESATVPVGGARARSVPSTHVHRPFAETCRVVGLPRDLGTTESRLNLGHVETKRLAVLVGGQERGAELPGRPHHEAMIEVTAVEFRGSDGPRSGSERPIVFVF